MNRIFKTIGSNSYILYNKDNTDNKDTPRICRYIYMSICRYFEGRVIKVRMGGGI